MKIGVLGGGAAGFFGAIMCAETYPQHEVILLEKSGKLLSKVRISGGGRCNVTHACFDNTLLVQNYPRGSKELRGPFQQFTTTDAIEWFRKRGVKLKTEADGRMFPVTDNSETIAQCLMDAAKNAGVKIKTNLLQLSLFKDEEKNKFRVLIQGKEEMLFDRILIATGSGTKTEAFDWLAKLGHTIVPPVPSLFTFNLQNHPLKELAGVSVEKATAKIAGSKLEQQGPLLITHWGVSGPAILKLSAWGARELAEKNYEFNVIINWLPQFKDESLQEKLKKVREENLKKFIVTYSPFAEIPARLWKKLAQLSGIGEELRWADVSKKQLNILIENLLRCNFPVKGKSTFKEEFVTAGGISLKDINLKTMESKKCPDLYFAGEVIDVDAVTGGFNFQNAWTTGFIAGKAIGSGEVVKW